jgi:hypothetical protein
MLDKVAVSTGRSLVDGTTTLRYGSFFGVSSRVSDFLERGSCSDVGRQSDPGRQHRRVWGVTTARKIYHQGFISAPNPGRVKTALPGSLRIKPSIYTVYGQVTRRTPQQESLKIGPNA